MFFAHGDSRNEGKLISVLLGFSLAGGFLFKDTLVIRRKDFDKSRKKVIEVFEDAGSVGGAGVVVMIFNKTAKHGDLSRVLKRTELNHFHVDFGWEILMNIENIRNTTRHTSSKVTSSGS